MLASVHGCGAMVVLAVCTLAYLVTGLCLEQNPSQLNDLGRILGDIDAMFVASGRYVNHHVAVKVVGRSLWSSGHFPEKKPRERDRRGGQVLERQQDWAKLAGGRRAAELAASGEKATRRERWTGESAIGLGLGEREGGGRGGLEVMLMPW